jgi:hypothetical protein
MLAAILLSLVANSAQLSPTARCAVAADALAQGFSKTSLPYVLTSGITPIRVKAIVGQFGAQLNKRFTSKNYEKDGSGGWVLFSPGHSPTGSDPPRQQTIDAFVQSPAVDALSRCPNLTSLTLKMGWARPFAFHRGKNSLGLYPYTAVSISLPIIDEKNNEAIVWVDQVSGPVAGSTQLMFLRLRHDGKWQVTSWFPIGVS